MKAFLCVLIVFLSLSCFAQPKDAIFKIISSKETDSDGVYLSLHLKINDSLEVDHTVVYYLMDQQDKSILHSMSDRDGEIYLAIKNFKYIKYIYVGGPGHVTTRINLTQFKGKDVDLELVVEPDLQPLID